MVWFTDYTTKQNRGIGLENWWSIGAEHSAIINIASFHYDFSSIIREGTGRLKYTFKFNHDDKYKLSKVCEIWVSHCRDRSDYRLLASPLFLWTVFSIAGPCFKTFSILLPYLHVGPHHPVSFTLMMATSVLPGIILAHDVAKLWKLKLDTV
jgi:hypothetical protein